MSMLSPGATFHAELREQLASVGHALSLQRALVWLARGLAAGAFIDLGIVVWAWTRDLVASLPLLLLVGLPLSCAALVGIGSLFVRHDTRDLARRVDRAASLQERSTTALELGGRGEEYALALAQMRDAVEHLKRVDLLETFPLRLPRPELVTTGFVVLVAVLIGISPNPWLLRARAANPAITVAREQAERVQRLADSVKPEDAPDLAALREIIRKGARTIDARSNDPEEALNALEDLEQQLRQMSAGDDQLAAALAAVASALASDPSTQSLASAINTGDMHEIANAARAMAQQTEQMDGQDRQRVAKVLRDASNRAGRASQAVAGELADAADALDAEAGAEANASPNGSESPGQQGGGARAGAAQNGRSAREALNELGNNAAAASERQRAQSQLEASRNALERALGRTQSRSAASGRSSSSASAGQRGQRGSGDQGQGRGSGQSGEPGDVGDQGGGGATGADDGSPGGEPGSGSGYSTGGQNMNRTGPPSEIDTITTPQQVPSSSTFVPDQSSQDPYLTDAVEGSARASDESVQPSFTRKATQGNDSASIPLGLRDLVKDYFSSLDQK